MLEERSAYGYYGKLGGVTGEEYPKRDCPICGKSVYRDEMTFTYDCHGIPFRLVCLDCYDKLMEKGYDGEYYTEADECIEPDW